MTSISKSIQWALAASLTLLAQPRVLAQNQDADKITEEDKKAFKDFKEGAEKIQNAQRQKALQAFAIVNLRQIGLALFEFETEYGSFPDGKTAAAVKEATGTKADLKAATANDCFFQLIAADIINADRVFLLEPPAEKPGGPPKQPASLEKCAFSYFSGMNGVGHPGRPLVVAPLVRGKTIFDPAVLGGKAVVLRADNSVQSFPIGKDGRVMIDGLDLFDPVQPFWDGKVPPILWPKD